MTLLDMDCFVYIAAAAALLFASKPSFRLSFFLTVLVTSQGPSPMSSTMSLKLSLLYSMFGLGETGGKGGNGNLYIKMFE